jgi:hypothetical protein
MPAWGELLAELQPHTDASGKTIPALTCDELRTKYISALAQKTGRNVVAYYSGWLKPGKTQNIDINDSDITGFMNALKGLDESKGLDLILHTPGGNPTATEGIVKYLHSKFGNNIRVIVPQMAMSAGTMLACSASKIIMGKHSCLGPIDPQYGGIPAYNIVNEFKEAKSDLDQNPQAKTYWELQLKKYPAAFFYSVVDSINLSSALVSDWLTDYMFEGEDPKAVSQKVKTIVGKLNANNKSHSRHFTFDFCKNLGLNVEPLESDQDLQELVLSVHHAFVITIDATPATKIIENQNGSRYITSQQR